MDRSAGIDVNVIVTPAESFWDDVWLKQSAVTSAWSMRPPGEGLAVAYTQSAKWKETHWERPDYDALLLPGGVFNPDRLRMNERAVQFVKAFALDNRPIAAICHGPWTLIEADALRDRRVTSWPSLKTDLRNAGAIWVDGAVIEDRGIITSRNPDDIPAFNQKMIEVFADAMRTRGPRQTTPA
jgi:protease I